MNERVRADVLWHQVSVTAKTITCAFDLNDDGMMKKAIEQSGGDDRIPD
jgi:hypothetical protein